MSNKREEKRTRTRRRFLRQLGLGAAGAPLLYPIANTLFNEAFAQDEAPQRLIFAINSGFPRVGRSGVLLPAGIDMKWGARTWDALDTKIGAWPSALAALESFRDHVLIADVLAPSGRASGAQHGGLYGVGTGVDIGHDNYQSWDVSGPSLEQQIARGPSGKQVPHPSVLCGISIYNDRDPSLGKARVVEEDTSTFAAGKNAPLKHTTKAYKLAAKLLGTGDTTAPVDSGTQRRRATILGRIQSDVKRLQTRLATQERERLDHFLDAIESYERRRQLGMALRCDASTPSFGQRLSADEELRAMFETTALAMKCGLTNVMGCTVGTDITHASDPDWSFLPADYKRFNNSMHHEGPWGELNEQVITVYTETIVDLLESLSGARGVMPANTTVVFTSDRGLARQGGGIHHGAATAANGDRWPVVIISSNPKLRTGGRYVRYDQGKPDNAPPGHNKPLGALYSTLTHAFGAPAEMGRWKHGPLQNLLV